MSQSSSANADASLKQLHLNSSIWGSSYWKVLYCIALTYPDIPDDNTKNRTKLFLQNMCLPCEVCQNDYITNTLIQYPVTDDVVSNRMNLLTWIKNIKNLEREKNNQTPPFVESDIYNFFEFFDNITARNSEYFCCENVN